MGVVNLDDYRKKDAATIKAECCMKAANDLAHNLRQRGYDEVTIHYRVNALLIKLKESLR